MLNESAFNFTPLVEVITFNGTNSDVTTCNYIYPSKKLQKPDKIKSYLILYLIEALNIMEPKDYITRLSEPSRTTRTKLKNNDITNVDLGAALAKVTGKRVCNLVDKNNIDIKRFSINKPQNRIYIPFSESKNRFENFFDKGRGNSSNLSVTYALVLEI